MKIQHWKQLKDFTKSEIVSLSSNSKTFHFVDGSGNWEVLILANICTYEGVLFSGYDMCYIKSIKQPTLPFSEVLKS